MMPKLTPHRACTVVLFAMLAACSGGVPTGAIRMAVAVGPRTLDPAQADDAVSALLAQQLFAPILSADPSRGLAQVEERDGALTLTLNAGAKWSDGQPIVSDDIIAAWRHVLASGTIGAKSKLRAIRGAAALADGRAVRLATPGVRLRGPPFVSTGERGAQGDRFVAPQAFATAVIQDSNLRRAEHVTPLRAQPQNTSPRVAWLGRGERALIVERRTLGEQTWLSLRTPDGEEAGWARDHEVEFDVLPPGYAVVDTGAQGRVDLEVDGAATATARRAVLDGDPLVIEAHEGGRAHVFHLASGLRGVLDDSDIDDTLGERLWVQVRTASEQGASAEGWVATRDLITDQTLGYERIDARRLVVHPAAGLDALRQALRDVRITAMPRHRLLAAGRRWASAKDAVTSGRYTVEVESAAHLRFVPADHRAPEVSVRVVPDEVVSIAAFRRGEIDIAWRVEVAPEALAGLHALPQVRAPSARALALRAAPESLAAACAFAQGAARAPDVVPSGRAEALGCAAPARPPALTLYQGGDRLVHRTVRRLAERYAGAVQWTSREADADLTLRRTGPPQTSLFAPRREPPAPRDLVIWRFDDVTLWGPRAGPVPTSAASFAFATLGAAP